MRQSIRFDQCPRSLGTGPGVVPSDAARTGRLRAWAAQGGVRLTLCVTLLLVGSAQAAGPAQVSSNGGSNAPPPARGFGAARDSDLPAENERAQEQMADRRNTDRQKQLVADTEKLFELAQQLRDEVAKSNKDQLSIPVVKRSEEIEKLARSVKEKMRGY